MRTLFRILLSLSLVCAFLAVAACKSGNPKTSAAPTVPSTSVISPSAQPSPQPSNGASAAPIAPSVAPSTFPSQAPTAAPSASPSNSPSQAPTLAPTQLPTPEPIPHSEGLTYEIVGGECFVSGVGACTDRVIVIPETVDGLPVTAILADAFAGSDLFAVILPDSVTTVGARAFFNCKNLFFVYFGAQIESVWADAFFGAALTAVYFAGTERDWNAVFFATPLPEEISVVCGATPFIPALPDGEDSVLPTAEPFAEQSTRAATLFVEIALNRTAEPFVE